MILDRCAMVDYPRDGWMWQEHPSEAIFNPSLNQMILTHTDHPDRHFEIGFNLHHVEIHLVSGLSASDHPQRSFFMRFPCKQTPQAMTMADFWSHMDHLYRPESWDYAVALSRMAHRWMLQSGAQGTWWFSLVGKNVNCLQKTRPYAFFDCRFDPLERCMIRTLQACWHLLLPLDGVWSFDTRVSASMVHGPMHARMEMMQHLDHHAEADAVLFGLRPGNVALSCRAKAA